MPGIYWTALLTTALAMIVYGFMYRRLPGPLTRRWVLLAFLVTLPLEPLAYYVVRVPLMAWLKGVLHVTLQQVNVPFPEMSRPALTYVGLSTLFAPVTEELAKLVPLLIPAIRRDINRENLARYALAIGVAFGIGELWFLAGLIAPTSHLPFYSYGGFLAERLIVCLNHAAFVACTLRWRAGILLAIALHWAGNLPIFFTASPVLLTLWVQLYFMSSLAWITTLAYGSPAKVGLMLLGRARCPECGTVYDRSLWGINAGVRRYEKCPGCRHWHWTGPQDEVTDG